MVKIFGTHPLGWLFKTEEDALFLFLWKLFHSFWPELFCAIRVRQHSSVCDMYYWKSLSVDVENEICLNKASVFSLLYRHWLWFITFVHFEELVKSSCKTFLRWNFLIWGSPFQRLLLKYRLQFFTYVGIDHIIRISVFLPSLKHLLRVKVDEKPITFVLYK